MLSSHYQKKVVRLKQKLAALSQKVARESGKRARISRDIAQVQRNITHTTSLPMLSAPHRRATWLQQEVAKTQKTLANLEEQVARKTDELYRAERQLASEREREQEAIERRHQHRELDHQRLITRELERQTKERQRQASTLVAFPVPAHAGWQEVSIRFTSDFQIQAKIRGQPKEARTYADLGFEDRRGKNTKPDVQWRSSSILSETAAASRVIGGLVSRAGMHSRRGSKSCDSASRKCSASTTILSSMMLSRTATGRNSK